MKKRLLSSLIILCILILNFNVVTTNAYNTGDDYPAKYKNKALDAVVDEWNFYNRECTSFVAWCLNSRNGVHFTNQYKGASRWGHAKTWGTVAKSLGITVDNNPAVGSVAWWNTGNYGHVAWVKAVNGNNVVIDEYNYKVSGGYNERTLNKSNITGFIHIKDLVHTHSYDTFVYQWKSHPHYNCYRCSCGEVKERANEPNFWDNCEQCLNSLSPHEQTVSDGLYTLKNASSGYMMNVYAGKDANGTKVTTWEFDGTTDQRIYIQHKGDGKYLLKFNASSSGRVVDINRGESLNASIDDGDKIDIWTADDLSAQYFWINNTGNNKYTFELASKPSHVIAAANSSAAASNGTQLELKYYTGAEYQKWYLCDTNGNVIGACTHNKTTNKTTNTAYNQKDESNHIVVTKYNMICSNCGETIKSNLSEEKTEPHIFSNNKCTKCNYEIVDNSQDEIEEPEETTEPEEQEKICAHTNTYQSKIKNSSVKIKNETHHSITETYDVICKDCNATVEKNLTGTRTEKHAFSDNLCSVCGYEKEIPNASFTDVTDVELAQTVASLSSLGIINGYEDGSFRPYNNITRAEFSKMICIAGKFQTTSLSSDNFEDVAQNHWARNYIYTAQRFGIINGISQTAFAPEANITYEQAIKMIVASLGYNDEAIQRGGYPNGYIEIAEELGILNGIYYRNTDYATRANIAKMIDAAMDIPFYVLNENNGTITKTYSRKSLYELHK